MIKFLSIVFLLTMQACSNDAKTHITQIALLQQMQESSPPIIIDVRSEYEYKAGHIPAALHIPFWDTFFTEQLQIYSKPPRQSCCIVSTARVPVLPNGDCR